MSTKEERVRVFEDTMRWIREEPKLRTAVERAKDKTEVFLENNYPIFDDKDVKDVFITVTKERSFEAAMRLHKEDSGSKIAVMNFANAFHAGGGVAIGSSAQEECLCRTSTLYPLLDRSVLRNSFYGYHSKLNTPRASDSLIYTEGVVICKTDEDLPERLPEEDWVSVDVITIAAPDLREKSNINAPLVGNGAVMGDAELFGYHVKRAIHMLTVAAYKGADTLVLGAFGCGAFKNNPNVVARAYKTALQEFPKVFERIVFAVYCSQWDTKNFEVFNNTFRNAALARIFLEVPNNWGLRGDPFFWDYLRTQSEKKDIESPEELEKWILDEFQKLSGEPMTLKSEVQIKRFAHGGKSPGTVSGNWWIKKGIPLLKSRMQ